MNDLIDLYIKNTYQEEINPLIYMSLELVKGFNIDDLESDLDNLLYQSDNIDNDVLSDLFLDTIKDKLKLILSKHLVSAKSETPLTILNEICLALYNFQRITDYDFIESRLNSGDDTVTIFIDLVDLISNVNGYPIIDYIEDVSPLLIKVMIELVELKKQESFNEVNKTLINKYKIFVSFMNGYEILSEQLIALGYKLNEKFSFYMDTSKLNELNAIVKKNHIKVAVDMLSVLMMSKDTYQLPIQIFSKIALAIFENKKDADEVRRIMVNVLNDFTTYEVEYEKTRLPERNV